MFLFSPCGPNSFRHLSQNDLMQRCKQPFVSVLDSSQRFFFATGIQKLVDKWNKCLNEFG